MANMGQPLTSAEWPGGWRKATRHPGPLMRQDVGVDGDAARTPSYKDRDACEMIRLDRQP
jgi:hypothetical protein